MTDGDSDPDTMTRPSWAVIAVLGLVSLVQQLHAMESEESVDVVEGGGVTLKCRSHLVSFYSLEELYRIRQHFVTV